MRAVIVVLQVLIVLVVVALALPGILAIVPAARDGSTALAIAVGIGVILFVLLRLVWPTRRT